MNSLLKLFCLTLICLIPGLCFSQSNYKINYQSGKISLNPLPQIIPAANSSDLARWGIAWTETGDGHYHVETVGQKKRPTPRPHIYSNIKTHEARVYLTPFYSVNDPFFIKQSIPRNKITRGQTQKTYNILTESKLAGIAVNTQDRMVPGHEIRIALHYKAPATTSGGRLFFFYNKPDELRADFDHFEDPEDVTLHYGEKDVSDKFSSIVSQLPAGSRAVIEDYSEDKYDGFMVFECSGMNAEEERRLFFSIESNDDLRYYQNEQRKLSFTAIWVPNTGTFSTANNIAKKELLMLAIHDPNYVKLKPNTVYFHKRKPNRVQTEIHFQNNGDEGTVNKATIFVPVDRSLNLHSVRLTNATHNAGVCPTNAPSTLTCIEIDSMILNKKNTADTLIFRFHNLDLYSKKSCKLFQKSKSKAFIQYQLTSSGKRMPKSFSKASIRFDTIPELIETNIGSVNWRQKSSYLKLGYNFGHQAGTWGYLDQDGVDRFGIGIGFQNAPIGTGIMWGGEINYNVFHFNRENTFTGLGPNGDLKQFQSEALKIRLPGVQVHVGYLFKNFISGFIGAGLAVPVKSEFRITSRLQNAESQTLAEDSDTVDFGLFAEMQKSENFNVWIEPESNLGAFWKWGIEVGPAHHFVLGLTHETRFCGQYYNDTSLKFSFLQAYLRIKISTLKGGKQ